MNTTKPYTYIIPKQDKAYLQSREDYAKRIIDELYNRAPIQNNASVVRGINIIQVEYKFIRLLDEAYKTFLLGLYHSTISLSTVSTERLCYDIIEKAIIKLDGQTLNFKQKKALFKIPYSTLIELLFSIGMITEQMKKDMNRINGIRQRYIHPVLEGNLYDDAKETLNLLCKIIDSFTISTIKS